MVAATAAPAFANSGGLTVADGATRIGVRDPAWRGLIFDDFTIQSTTALAAGELSVTLSASTPSQDVFFVRYDTWNEEYVAPPAPWSAPVSDASRQSITFTYSKPLEAYEAIDLSGFWTLVADKRMVPLTGFALNVVVSAPGATPVVRTFSEGLIVDGGRTRMEGALLAPDFVGPLFEDFTIQSSTALAASALVVTFEINEFSVIYDPRVHDSVAEPWVAEQNDGAEGKSMVTLTYSLPVEANVPVSLTGRLALVTKRDSTPVIPEDLLRVRVSALSKAPVSRLFSYEAS